MCQLPKIQMPRRRGGFTLIELVVVVLILGIIAAIAAPRLFDTANDARGASGKQSLAVIRDAIEMYRCYYGEFPGQAGGENGFKNDMATVMRIPFPSCPVGNQNDQVRDVATSLPLTGTGAQGWAYSNVTGEFIINHSSYETW